MLKIGSGAGFAGDRLEPAQILLQEAELDYLVLECLAERTIALAQKEKLRNPQLGYDPLLEKRIRRLLPDLIDKKVRLITNMGAANPVAGAQKIMQIAKEMNISCRVAAVTGDDVLPKLNRENKVLETKRTVESYEPILSANAYLGVEALLPALATDAHIIITGRVADPSLFLAPMVYHYDWSLDDYPKLGQGTIIGHLLECAGQISGGYFADPGKKEVPNLAQLGFPYAIVHPDGQAIITKVEGTGGIINLQTVKEQLLYEVHDPENYVTPDVIANFATVELEETEPNKVVVKLGSGKARPQELKVSLGYGAGFLGEGEISYAGPNAVPRAQLAGEIIKERLFSDYPELRIDYIGLSSVHRTSFGDPTPYEVRLRAAHLCQNVQDAQRIGEEVEALYTNGPAGGGGARKRVTEVIGVVSTFIPREEINSEVLVQEWEK